MARLRYVAGDQRPPLRISLENAGSPIDVSDGGATVRAYIREAGSTTLKDTLTGVKSTGLLTAVDDDTGEWTVDTTAPYDVAGAGGIVLFYPDSGTFDTAGTYQVEYEIDWGSSVTQTIYQVDTVTVRAQIG